MPASLETLNPLKKGSNPIAWVVSVFFLIVIVGAVMWGAPYVGSLLDQGAQAAGLPSSVEAQEALTGEEVISAAGLLGVGEHPYSTVTFSTTIKGKSGDAMSSISQYIWDEEPKNWGNPLNIDNDYTTPQGTDGSSIDVPDTTTITTSIMTATLSTALDEDTTLDAQGRVIPVNKRYYVHGSISGAPDLFFAVDLPSAGAVDSTSPTITLPTIILPKLDTTTWQSTVLDLEGGTTSVSGKEVDALVSYKIKDANVTQIKQIKLNDLNKLGDGGNLEEVTITMSGMDDWTPYDYSAGIDEFIYDGSTGFDAFLKGSDVSDTGVLATIDGGTNVDFEILVTADYGGANDMYDDDNGHTTVLTTVTITDIEDNTLLNQDVNA